MGPKFQVKKTFPSDNFSSHTSWLSSGRDHGPVYRLKMSPYIVFHLATKLVKTESLLLFQNDGRMKEN